MRCAIFVISYNRAGRVETYSALRDAGFLGEIFVVIDVNDPQYMEYLTRFGKELISYSKSNEKLVADTLESEKRESSAVYARNAVESIANQMCLDAFIILDDDITSFRYRWMQEGVCKSLKITQYIDRILLAYIDYMLSCNIATLSFENCMFYIGGISDDKISNERWTYQIHIRNTKFPVEWKSIINEDIITEIMTATKGYIWWSLPHVVYDAVAMNEKSGGNKDNYDTFSEYKRAIFATVVNPSSCKPGYSHGKLRIIQNKSASYPMIVSSRYKK